MTDEDHVFTQEELTNYLAGFTDGLTDDVKAALPPEKMAGLEDVSQGVSQLFVRLNNAKETIANLEKANEDYKAKIAAYAAEKADRMRESIPDDKPDDPAQDALDKINEEDDE